MKILIVEDDNAIAEALASLLEGEGYRPVRASDGLRKPLDPARLLEAVGEQCRPRQRSS